MKARFSAADPSTGTLLADARGGDLDALGRLLAEYRDYVRLLARVQIRRQFAGKLDPSDLVQETFLDCHRDVGQFRGTTRAEWQVWLRQMLSHNLLDHIVRQYGAQKRDVQRERSLYESLNRSSQMLEAGLVDAGASPSEHAQQGEHALLLAMALESLPEHYRDVLILRHFEQLAFPEVARRMDRTLGSVEKLWVRALAALRKAFVQLP